MKPKQQTINFTASKPTGSERMRDSESRFVSETESPETREERLLLRIEQMTVNHRIWEAKKTKQINELKKQLEYYKQLTNNKLV